MPTPGTGHILSVRIGANTMDFERGISRIRTALFNIKTLFALAGVYVAARFFGTMVRAAREFEFEMARVQAASGLSAQAIKSLGDDIKELSTRSLFSAKDLATGARFITQAGFTTRDAIMDLLVPSMQLANATVSDMETTTRTLITTLNQFALPVTEAARVAELLYKGVQKSPAEIYDMADALRYVGPVAHQVNVTVEDTIALLTNLFNVGMQGSMAGTAIRNIFLRLLNPIDSFNRRLKAAGIEVYDLSDVKFAGLVKTLRQTADAMDAVNATISGLEKQSTKTGLWIEGWAIALEDLKLQKSAMGETEAGGQTGAIDKQIELISEQMPYAEQWLRKINYQRNLEEEHLKEIAEYQKQLMASFDEMPKSLKDFEVLLTEIVKAYNEGLLTAEDIAKIGMRAAPAMAAIIETYSKTVAAGKSIELQNVLTGVQGGIKEANDIMLSTTQGMLTQLGNILNTWFIEQGTAIDEKFTRKLLTSTLNFFKGYRASVQEEGATAITALEQPLRFFFRNMGIDTDNAKAGAQAVVDVLTGMKTLLSALIELLPRLNKILEVTSNIIGRLATDIERIGLVIESFRRGKEATMGFLGGLDLATVNILDKAIQGLTDLSLPSGGLGYIREKAYGAPESKSGGNNEIKVNNYFNTQTTSPSGLSNIIFNTFRAVQARP